jgi:hypothetical protein
MAWLLIGPGAACRVGDSSTDAEFGTAALGDVELVFEGDDAAGGVDGGALVDQFPRPGGPAQPAAGVAAVPAGGTATPQRTPGAVRDTRGPQGLEFHHCQPARPPASCTRVRPKAGFRGDRLLVTEHHLRTRWDCGTRAALPGRGGRSNDAPVPFFPMFSTQPVTATAIATSLATDVTAGTLH